MLSSFKPLSSIWIFCLLLLNYSGSFLQAYEETSKAVLVLNTCSHSGFFACFNSVLGALQMYETKRYAGIKVDFTEGLYLDPEKGPNWWNYFFEPIQIERPKASYYAYTEEERLRLSRIGSSMPRKEAYALIQKYIHIKPIIKKELYSFYKTHFEGHYVIGIHHRGTDKILESSLVPYEKTLQALNQVLMNVPDSIRHRVKIYIATDEQRFLTFMQGLYPSQVIFNDFVRSSNGGALHADTGYLYANNYQKGREALIDCVLLSKCDYLIYPASSAFSMAALKLNPKLSAFPLTSN